MVFNFLKKNKRLSARELDVDQTLLGQYKRRRSPQGRAEDPPQEVVEEDHQEKEESVLKFTEWEDKNSVITLQLGPSTPGSNLTSDTLKRIRRQSSQQALNKSIKSRDFFQSTQSISTSFRRQAKDERFGKSATSRSIPSLLLPALYDSRLDECLETDSGDIYETVNQCPRSLVHDDSVGKPPALKKLDFFGSRTDLFQSTTMSSGLYSSKTELYSSPRTSEMYGSKTEMYGSKSELQLYTRCEVYSPRGTLTRTGGGGEESGNYYESDSGVSSLYEPLSFPNPASLDHALNVLEHGGGPEAAMSFFKHPMAGNKTGANSLLSSRGQLTELKCSESKSSSLQSSRSRSSNLEEMEAAWSMVEAASMNDSVAAAINEGFNTLDSDDLLLAEKSSAAATSEVSLQQRTESNPVPNKSQTLSEAEMRGGGRHLTMRSPADHAAKFKTEDQNSNCSNSSRPNFPVRKFTSFSEMSSRPHRITGRLAQTASRGSADWEQSRGFIEANLLVNKRFSEVEGRMLDFDRATGSGETSDILSGRQIQGIEQLAESPGSISSVHSPGPLTGLTNTGPLPSLGSLSNVHNPGTSPIVHNHGSLQTLDNPGNLSGVHGSRALSSIHSTATLPNTGSPGTARNVPKSGTLPTMESLLASMKGPGESPGPMSSVEGLVWKLIGQIDVPLQLQLQLTNQTKPASIIQYIQDLVPEICAKSGNLSTISEEMTASSCFLDRPPSPQQLAEHIVKQLQQRIELLSGRLTVLETEWLENQQSLSNIQSLLCGNLNQEQMTQLSGYCTELETSTRLVYVLAARIASCTEQLTVMTSMATEEHNDVFSIVIDREMSRISERRDQTLERLTEAKYLRKFTEKRRDRLTELIGANLPDAYLDRLTDALARLVDIVLTEEQIKDKIKVTERQRTILKILFSNVQLSVL